MVIYNSFIIQYINNIMKSSISVIGLLLGSSVEGLSLQKKANLMTPRSNAEEAHEKYIEE